MKVIRWYPMKLTTCMLPGNGSLSYTRRKHSRGRMSRRLTASMRTTTYSLTPRLYRWRLTPVTDLIMQSSVVLATFKCVEEMICKWCVPPIAHHISVNWLRIDFMCRDTIVISFGGVVHPQHVIHLLKYNLRRAVSSYSGGFFQARHRFDRGHGYRLSNPELVTIFCLVTNLGKSDLKNSFAN